ncbi:MAG: class I SAM-dependent methyltransferase [Candidatus Binatia bacterium]|jgi:SAM-dependent methyltransferase
MSFAYYTVDTGVEASQIFWSYDSVVDHVDLCRYETTLPVFLQHLPREGAILDAGCGLARWVIYLRERGYHVFGVDQSQTALRQTQRFTALPLFAGDTLQLPVKDESLAAVISLGVIEHVRSGPVPSLRELRRVLKPAGIALVAVPYNNPWRRVLINHLRRLRDWQKGRAGLKLDFAEYRFSVRELTGYLREAEFEVVSVHADDFHPPLGKGLWVDWSSFFGYGCGASDIIAGHKRWELNRRGRIVQWLANRITPWLIAGGVLAVARRK